MRYLGFALLFTCLLSPAVHAIQNPVPEQGRTMCTEIQESINRLAPFTQTSCRAGGGNTPDSMSFLVIALGPIWDDPGARQAWLEFVVEAAGTTLMASVNANAKVDEIIVADPLQLTERVAWGLPVALVKDIWGSVKDGRLNKDAMYPLIEKGLVKKPINAR